MHLLPKGRGGKRFKKASNQSEKNSFTQFKIEEAACLDPMGRNSSCWACLGTTEGLHDSTPGLKELEFNILYAYSILFNLIASICIFHLAASYSENALIMCKFSMPSFGQESLKFDFKVSPIPNKH